MNFFPNLQQYVKDDVETQNISYDYTNKPNLPNLPPIGYFANKKVRGLGANTISDTIKSNIESVCSPTDGFKCKYNNIKFGNGTNIITTQTTTSTIDTAIKSAFINNLPNLDVTFINSMSNILCQLPNIMVMLGYKYTSVSDSQHTYTKSAVGTTTYPNIILTLDTSASSSTNQNNQEQFNACQTVMSRSRLYDIGSLLTSSLFFGIKDLFIKLKSIKVLLSIILFITVYLLVQGTFSSADIAFKIASLVSNRSYPSYNFIIGILLGIGLPALLSIFMSRDQIKKTNRKYGKYDVTKNPYGTEVPKATGQEKSDTALVAIMLGLAYTFIFIIYFMMRDKNNSPIIKIGVSAIFYILLTCIIFLLFYWAPIVSFASDEEEDRAFGISRPLKVWTKGDDNKDISSIISNKYIDRYLRRYFAIYAICALFICIIYLAQSNSQRKTVVSSFFEGIMASCAIIALPILWIFNWYTGITLFIAYPMILMIARYFRYPLYYLLRQMYLTSPQLQSECTKLKQEFDHPESYTAPWDLMGVTLFKYFIKFNCGRALYSDIFVDYRDGYRDISSNSYVTGHIFRIAMKDKNGPFDYYHHSLVFIVTIIVFIFLILGVIGKENAF